MEDEVVQQIEQTAQAAAAYASDVRSMHRKRSERGSRQREADIAIALSRLRAAMRPIRSELARAPYGKAEGASPLQAMSLSDASQLIQRERRKLWKMQKRERPKRRSARR